MFSKGNVNVNSSESIYILDPKRIVLGIIFGLIFQAIVLGILYCGFEATITGVLLCLILMAIGDMFFIGTAVYTSRLYLREEMIDMASLFASYNPQILQGGGGIMSQASQMIKDGKIEAMGHAQLVSELEQLKRTYENLIANSQTMDGSFAPLSNMSNTDFIPFIDGE